jgi:hypothetical protein
MIPRPHVLIAITALALVAAFLPLPTLVAACIILVFLAVVPGVVCCGLLSFDISGAFGWTIVLAASFAIDTLVNEVLLYSHLWTPTTALLTIATLAVVGVLVKARGDRAPDVQPLSGPSAR